MGHGWVECADPANLASCTAQLRKMVEGKTLLGDFCPEEQARRTVSLVMDHSNDRQEHIPAALYYAVGNIELVVRYTFDEMRRMLDKHGHYGHWDLPETFQGRAVL